MRSNQQILKGAVTTADLAAGGYLSPEQARQFIRESIEKTALLPLVRTVMKTAKTGEIDKIGVGRRLLRKKVENTDDNYRAKPLHDKIEYATVAVRLPWEITEETLRENIEGEGYEATVTALMTAATGVDLEDLCINSDSATAADDVDHDFLYVNDGWLKQMETGGRVEDRTSKSSGAMNVDVFYDALRGIDSKYNDGNLRWLMSPARKQEWDKYLLNAIISNGGAIPPNMMDNPASIPAVGVPRMPDSKIALTATKNFGMVNTYDVKIRKTDQGREAILQDKRFYVIHLDFDPIIEELDACILIKGLAAL